MTKRKRQKTIQWPKEKDTRQYNDQKKKTEDNTMTKRNRQRTIQWPKEKNRRQYNDQKKKTEDTETYGIEMSYQVSSGVRGQGLLVNNCKKNR